MVAPAVVPTVPVAGTAAPVQVAQAAPVVAEPLLSAPTCPVVVVPVVPTLPAGSKSPIQVVQAAPVNVGSD